jgi:hypothetical protein
MITNTEPKELSPEDQLINIRLGRERPETYGMTGFWEQRGYKGFMNFWKQLYPPQFENISPPTENPSYLQPRYVQIEYDFTCYDCDDEEYIRRMKKLNGVNVYYNADHKEELRNKFLKIFFSMPVRILWFLSTLLFRVVKMPTYTYKKNGLKRFIINLCRIIASPFLLLTSLLSALYGLINPEHARPLHAHVENLEFSRMPGAVSIAHCMHEIRPKNINKPSTQPPSISRYVIDMEEGQLLFEALEKLEELEKLEKHNNSLLNNADSDPNQAEVIKAMEAIKGVLKSWKTYKEAVENEANNPQTTKDDTLEETQVVEFFDNFSVEVDGLKNIVNPFKALAEQANTTPTPPLFDRKKCFDMLKSFWLAKKTLSPDILYSFVEAKKNPLSIKNGITLLPKFGVLCSKTR